MPESFEPSRSFFQNRHFALTQLTRLARRRGAATKWLEAAFDRDFENLALVGLDVAIETGDPIGQVLLRCLRCDSQKIGRRRP